MTDEIVPAHDSRALQAELEKSRESAAALLEGLATKISASRAVRQAANGIERATHYVHEHSLKEVASEIDIGVRSRPVAAIVIAVVAGFFIGRALRSR